MKTIDEIIPLLQTQKPFLARQYGVREIGVFGSYIRREQKPDSDLDVLVEFAQPTRIGLIGLAGLENYLSDQLGVKVDLVIKKNLKRHIGERILREVVML